MNKLRQEIRTILDGTDSSRPAALRRCRREDWLYATDLPQAASGEAVDAFLRMMESSGWRARQEAGWILLDRIPEMPPEISATPLPPQRSPIRMDMIVSIIQVSSSTAKTSFASTRMSRSDIDRKELRLSAL